MKARVHFFYFRTVSTIGDDDTNDDSIMVPVDKITGFTQKSDTTLEIWFKNVSSSGGGMPMRPNNMVRINIKSGTRNAVMALLAAATNGPVHTDGITIVADDITSTYLSTDITSCNVFLTQTLLSDETT
tara:strand:- start:107 stop:493 length:387 start_codon:yes stop_codon:yes gene_type:complete